MADIVVEPLGLRFELGDLVDGVSMRINRVSTTAVSKLSPCAMSANAVHTGPANVLTPGR